MSFKTNVPVIAIDGPASSGKGSVSKIIAKHLGFNYLESGAIYRIIGLLSFNHNIDINDSSYENKVLELINDMKLEFIDNKIFLNNVDVTSELRQEHIGMIASKLSQNTNIRNRLLDFQRSFASLPGLVTDGRDMGSVVFPHATLKVFLTASVETRAKRRFLELQKKQIPAIIEVILEDIIRRDEQDTKRAVAPLIANDTYKILDNSNLSIEDTVKQILTWYELELFKK